MKNTHLLSLIFLFGILANIASAEPDTWVYFGCVGSPPGIYRATLDSETGSLSAPERIVGGPKMSFLAFSPDKTKLYAVQAAKGKGLVSAFAVDAKSGDLKKLNQQSIGSRGACHVAVTPDGRTVTSADYGDGAVAAFAVAEDGALKPRAADSFFKHEGSSVNAQRQESSHAHCTMPSPDGKFIYVADLGVDAIFIYAVEEPGKLSLVQPTKIKNLGGGPRHLAFHPSGDFVFSNLELTSEITAFSVDKSSGELTELASVSTLPEPHEGNSTSELLCHPSQKFFYCANRGHNSIAGFAYEGDGVLKPIGHASCGGEIPRNFGISPDGGWILTANQKSKNIGVLRVDVESGKLKLIEDGGVALPQPMCVRFLPMAK